MCIFSGDVESVSKTKIFARVDGEHQFLVYSMDLEASRELAMILPIPVPARTPEGAVQFIDLSGYPEFFEDMAAGFPVTLSKGMRSRNMGPDSDSMLEVHEVGSFDASFVPSIADFSRLDDRFKLPGETWSEMPQYADYGFVVFKFRPGEGVVHPMAFKFPTRYFQDYAFFPTVHVHDGAVHGTGDFDHVLYGQGLDAGWMGTERGAFTFMDRERSKGVLSVAQVYKKVLRGERPNVDQLVDVR